MGMNSNFDARLLRPVEAGDWCFVVLPKVVSEGLPRRGRTSVEGTLNGVCFEILAEPDGKLSHWLRLGDELLFAAGVEAGDVVDFEVGPVGCEPEPEVPDDMREAFEGCPEARVAWDGLTVLARVDWIHWMVSAKQAKTRAKRVASACEMLVAGKKRVCCFDPSGFYSKAFGVPEAAG